MGRGFLNNYLHLHNIPLVFKVLLRSGEFNMLLFLSWFLLLNAAWPQGSPQNVGTKLVWHYTSGDFAGGEVTTYTMGDRRRTEYRNTMLHRDTVHEPMKLTDPSPNVVIQRCDLAQAFELMRRGPGRSASKTVCWSKHACDSTYFHVRYLGAF